MVNAMADSEAAKAATAQTIQFLTEDIDKTQAP
jgi:hypothetical protein